ncbi:MAG: hypothetical protein V4773_24540 [Verrucomicrobiota bacterium]
MQLVSSSNSSRPTWTRLFATLTLGAIIVFCSVAAFAAQPAHLAKGLQLFDEISGAQDAGVFNDAGGVSLNRYGGSWNSATDASFIRFANLPAGILAANNTKCSPLVTHLLKNVYNWNWSAHSFYDPLLKTTKTSVSPAPYQYIALLKAGKGFASQVTRLDLALPGDLLFWWQVGTDDKDHAMIITHVNLASAKAYPTTHANSLAAHAGTTYYEVEVLDSSSSLHTNDSRLLPINGIETHVPGIGMGTIGVLVRANFEIVGVTWSLPTSDYTTQRGGWLNGLHSRLKLVPAYEVAIGRWPAQP